MRLYDKNEEDQGDPNIDVLCRYGVSNIPIAYPQGQLFRGNDGDIIRQGKDKRTKIVLIVLCQFFHPLSIAIPPDFTHNERTAFFQPVLMLQERNVLLMVSHMVLFQPYIEQTLTQEAVDAGFVGAPARNVEALLDFAEDVEEPRAVSVEEVTAHDEHVEHVCPGAVHDRFEGNLVLRIAFLDDGFREVEAFRVVCVVVVRTVALDVVAAFARHDDGRLREQFFPVALCQDFVLACFDAADFAAREVAAVVYEPDVVGRQVFPGPVEAGEFAVVRVFRADVVAGVIAWEAYLLFARVADVNRQVAGVRRHPVRLVRRDQYLDVH